MVRRSRRAPRQGCWVEPTRGGLLRFRFRWRMPGESDLRKFAETTELLGHTGKPCLAWQAGRDYRRRNSRRHIRYARWFPSGNRVGAIQLQVTSAEVNGPKRVTIGEYYRGWIERRLPPLVGPSRAPYRNHFCTYILPSTADVELARFSLEHLEDLRLRLQAKQGLGPKNDTKRD